MKYSAIHVWGDSIARGIVYNPEKQRYAISKARCTDALQQAVECEVVNHSVMGATVREGMEAFARFTPVRDALCAVEYGGNDCDPNWQQLSDDPTRPVTARVPLEEYSEHLRDFVRRIRRGGMKPMLITPLPICPERYFAWVTRNRQADHVLKALGDVGHIYRWQERYSLAMRHVAAETGTPLLDLRDCFLALDHYENYLCQDGIHPNEAGYRLLSAAVLDAAQADPAMPWRSQQKEA
ncbi:MAG: SGNH/GDSL hydrolase family protein [Candidatus Limiplasma sp.]|nr:SGNH/GDSL hydrolase family protein [Candidatus Limiplasma sp.]